MLYEGGEIDAHPVSLAQMTNSSTTVQLRNAAPLLYSICWQQLILTKMFDTKKITTTPKDQWEAINALVKKEQELITALHIMESIIDNPEDEFKELHEKRIKEFLSNYEVVA